MQKIIYTIVFCCLLLATQDVFCQKYKTPEDTIRLNKEYMKIAEDSADLALELTKAQDNLIKYQADFASKDKTAKSSAEESSRKADKATNGEVSDAKKAKKKADQAYEDAKDADKAKDKMESEEKKIKKLNKEFQNKKERLVELNLMREAINNLPEGQ